MKFTTASEHRNYYQSHQSIEFDSLLSEAELKRLNQAIDEVLAERLEDLRKIPHAQRFAAGRDLWRDHPLVKGFVCNEKFSRIVAELTEVQTIRLGYDQLWEGPARELPPTASLKEFTPIEGLLCGLVIALKPTASFSLIPHTAGNGTFFQPSVTLSLSDLQAGGRYLLIAYGRDYLPARLHPLLKR